MDSVNDELTGDFHDTIEAIGITEPVYINHLPVLIKSITSLNCTNVTTPAKFICRGISFSGGHNPTLDHLN